MKDINKAIAVVIILIISLTALQFVVSATMVNEHQISVNDTQSNSIVADSALSANVQFNESGLPSGTTWAVALNGLDPYNEPTQITQSSTSPLSVQVYGTYQQGTYVIFSIPDVSYAGITFKPSVSNGQVLLSNVNNYLDVSWTEILGNLVTINILGGLPGEFYGLQWSGFVTNNQSIYLPIHTNSQVWSYPVPNGTYYFQLNNSANAYFFLPHSGYFSVYGQKYTINAKAYYNLTGDIYNTSFEAHGIPNGQEWNLTIVGHNINQTFTQKTNNVQVPLTYGYSYNFTVNSTGYNYIGITHYNLTSQDFGVQIILQFQTNYGTEGSWLDSGLQALGINVTIFFEIIFLVGSLILALGFFRLTDSIIYTALAIMALVWISAVVGLTAYNFPIPFTLLGIVGIFADRYEKRRKSENKVRSFS